jgi:hypothetical protein
MFEVVGVEAKKACILAGRARAREIEYELTEKSLWTVAFTLTKHQQALHRRKTRSTNVQEMQDAIFEEWEARSGMD